MVSFKNKIWSLLNNGIELTLGIGLVAAITRMYSPEAVGVWFLFITVFALTSSLRDALIQSALVKSTAGVTGPSMTGALKTNLLVMLGFEAIVCVIVVTASFYTSAVLGKLLLLYPFYALPNAWFRWQIFYLRSQLRVKEIFISNLVNLVILSLLLGFFFLYQVEVGFLVPALGIGSLVGGFCTAFFVPYREILASNNSKETLTLIRRFGFFGMLREATSSISSRVSLFYSSALLNLHQTALLGVSQRFSQLALLPNNAFQSLLFPSMVILINSGKKEEIKSLFEKSIAQLLAITLPLALLGIVLSPMLLEWLSGETYRQAWPILAAYLFLATVITPFGSGFGSLVTAIGKPHLAFRVVLVNSILNTSLGFLFMKYIGLTGAPLALAITEIGGLVWVSSILKKEAGISVLSTFLHVYSIYSDGAKSVLLTLKRTPSIKPISVK